MRVYLGGHRSSGRGWEELGSLLKPDIINSLAFTLRISSETEQRTPHIAFSISSLSNSHGSLAPGTREEWFRFAAYRFYLDVVRERPQEQATVLEDRGFWVGVYKRVRLWE